MILFILLAAAEPLAGSLPGELTGPSAGGPSPGGPLPGGSLPGGPLPDYQLKRLLLQAFCPPSSFWQLLLSKECWSRYWVWSLSLLT